MSAHRASRVAWSAAGVEGHAHTSLLSHAILRTPCLVLSGGTAVGLTPVLRADVLSAPGARPELRTRALYECTVQGKSFVDNNKLQSLRIRTLYEACKQLFD